MSVVTILPDCKHGIKTNASNTPTNSLKSMDSLYTTSSSKFSALNRRKSNQRNRDRAPGLVPVVSEIKQRVISARLLRMKQMQNQIGEAHHRIAELTAENRLLKSLHKRQDSALSKYENSSAELPKLLNSHAEEVRVWQTRCRNLQRLNKELQGKIKQKDTIILTITDQNKHLLQLNKDKSLEEREKLADRVKDLEQRLLDKDNDMKLLARRLQLESKAYKSNLNIEQQKYRELLSKIELSDYLIQSRTEAADKKSPKPVRQNYRVKSPTRSMTSKSATNLTNGNGMEKELVTLVLPPCEGQERKPEESIKTNSPRVNVNVKLSPSSGPEDDVIDLTKIRVDKSDLHTINGNSHHDGDDVTVTIRNGNRARAPLKSSKATAKLTPMHPKQETKKSSDDSELSDDDFKLFSEHNGTKMAHNARDLLEHKMHLSELESKMKQNSLEAQKHVPSSSSSSLSDQQHTITAFDLHSYNDRGDNELVSIQREIRNSMMRRESFLDEYCDTLVDVKSDFSRSTTATLTEIKKLELASQSSVADRAIDSADKLQTQATNHSHHYGKSNGSLGGRPSKLDPKKKTTLLATLKHIDNESFDA